MYGSSFKVALAYSIASSAVSKTFCLSGDAGKSGYSLPPVLHIMYFFVSNLLSPLIT